MKELINNTISTIKQGFENITGLAHVGDTGSVGSIYNLGSCEDTSMNLSPNYHRKPVAILYADIAEYSRLTEQDEEGTHLRLLESLHIMRTHVAANRGRVAHCAGDAILAEFSNADSALHCAINAQLVARQWNDGLDPDQQVLFRIGVHFGDVIANQGDIFGNAVNLAARLEQLAVSGGICVSELVRDKLRDHSSFRFVAMGKQQVKNISEPVNAFRIDFERHQINDPGFSGVIKISAMAS
jgi:class 3 adenylate cyclase